MTNNSQLLLGKTAIITGGAGGIGKAAVKLFLENGATCVAVDVNEKALQALLEEFIEHKERLLTRTVDLTNRQQVDDLIDWTVKEAGKLDILFNNAGIMDGMFPISEVDDDLWERVLKINTTALMYSSRKAVQYFLADDHPGVIINTASHAGVNGGRAGFSYTASKHAVVGMTKSIAFMHGPQGIRCNAICPGAVSTKIGYGSSSPSEYGSKRVALGMPLNERVSQPEEIASVALFLASDSASFVNGAIIIVDGGWGAF